MVATIMSVSKAARAWGRRTLIAAIVAAAPLPAPAGVRVALLPANSTVAPGSEFDLSMEVTEAGSNFNGFDAYVGYDPAALTFVQLSPLSLQEGSYFVAACANRFHRFHAGADRDTITDVLLCNGVSLTGPGQIYKLRFRASSTPQVTTVRFLPGLQFYNAGLYVNPSNSSDATIVIGAALGVGDPSPRVLVSRLVASPNPARGGVAFTVETVRGGLERLVVCDLQGRVVRHLESGDFPAGRRVVQWDGRNDSGRVVPAGIYLGSLRSPRGVLKARFTLLN